MFRTSTVSHISLIAYSTEQTPLLYREWLQVIDDSLDGSVDESLYHLPEIEKVLAHSRFYKLILLCPQFSQVERQAEVENEILLAAVA